MMTGADRWDVRVHWKPSADATCPAYSLYIIVGESEAVDAAVSVLDGCRHPWSPVQAAGAEVRRTGDAGPWRQVAPARTYL